MAANIKIHSSSPPPDKDITKEIVFQDFSFTLQQTVKVTESTLPAKHTARSSVVSTCNKYGLVAVGCTSSVKVYRLSDLLATDGTAELKEVVTIETLTNPQHVAFNCDGSLISVYTDSQHGRIIHIYSVLQDQTPITINSTGPDSVLMDLAWNPTTPHFLSVIFSDMVVKFCKIEKASLNISSVPLSQQATCMCWSPKGKQLAIGCLNGSIIRVDQSGKTTFIIPPSPNHLELAACGLFWQSTYTYFAAYTPKAAINSSSPQPINFMTVRHGKDKPIVYSDYTDIWFSSGNFRINTMLVASLAPWDMAVLMCSNSVDSVLLTHDKSADQWSVSALEDTARISVPMVGPDFTEHFPLGLAVCFNSTMPLPLNDSYTHPPCPIICMLSTDGTLSLYHTINRLPDTDHSLVKPPEPVSLPLKIVRQPGIPQTFGQPSAPAPAAPPAATAAATPTASVTQPISQTSSGPFGSSFGQQTGSLFGGKGGSMFGQQPAAAFGAKPGLGSSAGFGTLGALTSAVQQPAESPQQSQQQPPQHQPPQQQPPPPQTPPKQQTLQQPQQEKVNTSPAQATEDLERIAEAERAKEKAEKQMKEEAARREEAERIEVARLQKEKKLAEMELQRQADIVYNTAVKEESSKFTRELEALKRQLATPIPEVLARGELVEMNSAIEDTKDFSSDIKENVQAINQEIHSLKLKLLESLAYMNQVRTLYTRSQDPQYKDLLYSRPLDPKLNSVKLSIEKRFNHLTQEVLATDSHLDELWLALHQNKSQGRAADNALQSDMVYKSLSTIERIVVAKKMEVDSLAERMGLMNINRPVLQQRQQQQSGNLPSSSLSDISLSVTRAPKTKMSGDRVAQLREFLSSRACVPVVKCAPSNLKPTAVQRAHATRKLKPAGQVPVTLSPTRPAQPVSSTLSFSKTSMLSTKAMLDSPKPVTQSKPSGITQPVANRAEASKPTPTAMTKTGPLFSKISQPTQDAAPVLGVRSAFNVPKEQTSQAGQNMNLYTAPAPNITSPFAFTKPSTSKAGGPQPPSGGARPPVQAASGTLGGLLSSQMENEVITSTAAMTPTSASKPVSTSLFGFSKPPVKDSTEAKASGVEPKSLFGGKSSQVTSVAVTTTNAASSLFGKPVAASAQSTGASPLTFSTSTNSTSIFGGSGGTAASGGTSANSVGGLFTMIPPVAKSSTSASSATPVSTPTPTPNKPKAATSLFGTPKASTKPTGNGDSLSEKPTGPSSVSGGVGTTPAKPTDAGEMVPTTTATMEKPPPPSYSSATATVSNSATASSMVSGFGAKPAFGGTGLFGNLGSSTSGSLFGAKTTPSSTSTIFGGLSTSTSAFTSQTNTTASSLFGGKAAAQESSTAAVTTTTTTTTTTTASALFGAPGASQDNNKTPVSAISSTGFGSGTSTAFTSSTATSTTSSPSLFGGSAGSNGASSVFGSITSAPTTSAATTSSSVFGAVSSAATSAAPLFGNAATTTTTSMFGTGSKSVFGGDTASTTTTSSLFGSSAAATSTSTPALFGKTVTTASSLFGGVATSTASSPFGGVTASTTSSIFGGNTISTSNPSPFGSASTTNSPFRSPAPTTTASVFGGTAPATTAPAFGGTAAATTASVFGGTAAATTASVFGGTAPATTASAFGGTAAVTTPSVFGGTAAATTKPSTGIFGSGFGLGGTPDPEKAKVNPFGKAFGTPSADQTAAKNLFGAAKSSPFGAPIASTSSSVFGGASASSSSFGSSTTSGFGSSTTSGFGSSTTSGFGAAPTFGTKPSVFGGAATFGSPPAFGSKPAFGSTTSPFGGSASSGATSGGFGSMAQQDMPTFGTLAGSTNMSSFGSLAGGSTQATPFGQQQSTPFGQQQSTPFGQQQSTPFGQQQSTPFGSPGFGTSNTFGQQTTSPFGGTTSPASGSSFSSYR